MGGKLLNGRRVGREEFLVLEEQVVSYLKANLLSKHVYKLIHLSDKETFGDLDLVVSNTLTESILKLIDNPVKNGDVISFLWSGLQVDLILVSSELLDYSVKYFSFGDRSNLLGRLIKHTYGLTFSSKGLYKKHHNKKIYLDFDYDGIVLKLLGLTPKDSYTEKELFDWVISSSFFNREVFQLNNLTSEQRARDKKRAFYQRWLSYIEYDTNPYPELATKIKEIDDELEHQKKINEVYSGVRIKEMLGIEGKHLGDFIRWCKHNNKRPEDNYIFNMYSEFLKESSYRGMRN